MDQKTQLYAGLAAAALLFAAAFAIALRYGAPEPEIARRPAVAGPLTHRVQ